MKHIKIIIFLLLYYPLGCSYVSDYTEGLITKRASFSINAEYKTEPDRVLLTWSETDLSEDFAGIEIYRTSRANDEYSSYEMIAYKWNNINGNYESLNNGSTKQYIDDLTHQAITGVYFYRVGFIQWDHSKEDRQEAEKGYTGANPDYTDFDQNTYHAKTHINKISGYAKVHIP